MCSQKMVKRLFQDEISGIEFPKSWNHRQIPSQVAIGMTVHQAVRSKKILNILNGFVVPCEYNKLLRIESQIENTVLDRMQTNGGVNLLPDIV